jgi:hypothetical protein
MKRSLHPFLALALVGVGATGHAAEEPKPLFPQRWFYASHNLMVDASADDLIALIGRAGKSGYNGLVLADYKLNVLDRVIPRYFQNVARVRKAADAAGIEIIPCVFPIGYSDGILAHDPNLAEGLTVRDAPFVVRGREAVLAPEKPVRLLNGGLEETKGDRFPGFDFQDNPGQTTFADRDVVHGGRVSCRMQDVGKHSPRATARLIQRVEVRPHACYRFSCWVKTRGLEAPRAFRLTVVGAGKESRQLTFHETHLKPTQDWTPVEVVFNSLGESAVNLYAGMWSARGGTLWLDDLDLQEQALVNVLRRPGCPLTVTSQDGKTPYEEGKDFLPVRDPKLGTVPYLGQYSFSHAGPKVVLTADSRIKDGERLRVSWYHPVRIHADQMMCCLSESKVAEVLREQARKVNDLLRPATFFMSHDEVRVAGWCAACRAAGETPGELLAANVRRCVEILKEVNPRARIVVWSDMFDPHHNAVDHYFLANGSLAGSWEGLPPEVVVANWNGEKAAASLRWFADRGHSQVIAGYYDGGLENLQMWRKAARGVPRVGGFLYTTWENKYDLLEAYGMLLLGKE